MPQYVVVVVADYDVKFSVTLGESGDALLSDSLVDCIGDQPSGCHPLAPILADWRTHPNRKKPWEIAVRLLFADHLLASSSADVFSSRPLSLPMYMQNTLRVWIKHSLATEDMQWPDDCQTLVGVVLKERGRLQNAMLYGLSLVHMLFQVAEAGRIFSIRFPLSEFARLKASLLFVSLGQPKRNAVTPNTAVAITASVASAETTCMDAEVGCHSSRLLSRPSELPFVAFAQAWSVAPGSFIRSRMATLMLLDTVREWCVVTFTMADGLLLLDSLLEKTWLWTDTLTERGLFFISSVDILASLI
jgi:hypothetical protein